MMTIRKKWLALAVAAVCAGNVGAADDDRTRVETLHETTLNLIQLLVDQGVLKQEAADAMLAKAKQQASDKLAQQKAAETSAEKGVVRVTYVPESVKREIREQVRQEVVAQAKEERWGDVNAVPEWLDRLKWDGDIRLRYQGDFFSEGNASEAVFRSAGQNISNTLSDRHRERVRLRLGLSANVAGGVDAGVRITTGNTSDPVSTNQSLGNTGNKYNLVLDRAFLKLAPVDDLTLWGGRIPNPFFSTDLVWDDDLNFEGAAVSYAPGALDPQRAIKPFVTAGVFPLQEIEKNAGTRADDKWLFAAQAGMEWVPSTRMRFKLGAAYYQYENIAATLNPVPTTGFQDATQPQSRQKGNSLFVFDSDADNDNVANEGDNLFGLASDFRIGNLSLVADFADFYPIHVIASFDWAHNFGFDRGDILKRSGQTLDDEVDGYQVKLTIGHPKFTYQDDGEWQAFVGYRYLERDAVLDAFTDSDFHLGGTNHKGFMVGGSYALFKNTWLSARWMSSDQISGLPLSIDVLQLDLNAKF
ncbi:MAG: putative porin [Thiobacillus sp.]